MSKKIVEIGTEITLNETEQLIVKGIAKKRYESNRDKDVKNSKIGKQSNESTDIEGFGAEMAFCRLFNLFPDFSIKPRSSKDDKGDAELHIEDGVVDVKGTKHLRGRLITPTWKNAGAVDKYALMVGEFPTYVFKGFMGASDLMVEDRIGDMGYGKKSYIAEQDELKAIEFPI